MASRDVDVRRSRRSIRTRPGRANVWVVTALALLIVAAIYHLARSSRGPDPITVMRDSLAIVRAGVDSCRLALDRERNRLAAYDHRLDSLRDRVRDLETIDPRGVPADSYSTYLEAFSSYNDSVPGWEQRADSLRAHWRRCREMTETHNALADSLRRALVQQMRDDEGTR